MEFRCAFRCLLALSLVMGAAGLRPLPAQDVQWCWQPADAAYFRDYYRSLFSSSTPDSLTLRVRRSLHLPTTRADEVQIETDNTVCHRAAIAHYQGQYDNLPAEPVLIIRVGSQRYVVYDGRPIAGGRSAHFIYDPTWKTLATTSW